MIKSQAQTAFILACLRQLHAASKLKITLSQCTKSSTANVKCISEKMTGIHQTELSTSGWRTHRHPTIPIQEG
jgi:hypothetical protein